LKKAKVQKSAKEKERLYHYFSKNKTW
jgi:hypothetical protein